MRLTKEGLLRIHFRNGGGDKIACNFKCSYCIQRAAIKGQFLKEDSFLRIKEIWDKLSKIEDKIVVRLNFNGECLIDPLAMELFAYISNLSNVNYCELITNNSINPKHYLNFINTKKISFNCSFHPEGISIDRFIEHMQILKKAGCPCFANMVVTPQLLKKLPEIYERFKKEGIEFKPVLLLGWYPPQWEKSYTGKRIAYPNGYTDEEKTMLKQLYFSPEEYDYNFKQIQGYPCYAGVEMINLKSDGEVRRCFETRLGTVDELLSGKIKLLDKPTPCPRTICSCYAHNIYLKEFREKYNLHPAFADHYEVKK